VVKNINIAVIDNSLRKEGLGMLEFEQLMQEMAHYAAKLEEMGASL